MDTFQGHSAGLISPAEHHFAVVPNDGADLPVRVRALRIGGAGTVVVRDAGGVDITYNCADGEVLDIRAVRVLATATTATDIVGWY